MRLVLIAHYTTLCLAAASAQDAAFTGNATNYVSSVAVPILGLVLTVVALFLSNKRHPPLPEEMHKNFVPRAEHDANIQRLHGRVDKLAEDQSNSRMQFSKAFGDLEHAIGRLEGRLDREGK